MNLVLARPSNEERSTRVVRAYLLLNLCLLRTLLRLGHRLWAEQIEATTLSRVDRVELEQRRRLPSDDVMSTAEVADLTHLSRQGVDRALREGRLTGFRDPGPPVRLWIERSSAEARVPTGSDLRRRVDVLESAVDQLRAEIAVLKDGSDADASLRAENVTLRSHNLQLLAAAEEQGQIEDLLHEAMKLEREARTKADEARTKADEAMELSRQVRKRYADALSQSQLPGTPASSS